MRRLGRFLMIATIVQLLPVIILLLGDLRVTYSFPMHRTTRLSCPFTRSTRNFSSKNALILPRDPDDRPIQTIAAPMVAASDYAFRCLCRQYGVDLTFTQMIHATNLLANKQFGRNHLDLWEYTTPKQSEWSRVQLELFEERSHSDSGENPKSRSPLFQKSTADMSFITGPTIVQLAGHEPATVVKAAQRILEHTDGKVHGFDLNLGCPQGIARKGNYGAFLMEQDPANVYSILSALRQSLPETVAVSAKIRLPLDPQKLPDRISRLLDTGIDFLTIHGRTLRENKVAVGACHVDEIAQAIQIAQQHTPDFPVVANGGVEHHADVDKIRKLTGAVAVMSSEGLLENPGIFTTDSSEWSARQTLQQQFQYAVDYLSWCRLYPPLPGTGGFSSNIVRAHLFKFLFRYLSAQTHLRDKLASPKTRHLCDFEQVCQDLYDVYEQLTDEELEDVVSSRASVSWYRRHRLGVNPSTKKESTKPILSIQQRKEAAKSRILELRAQRQEKRSDNKTIMVS